MKRRLAPLLAALLASAGAQTATPSLSISPTQDALRAVPAVRVVRPGVAVPGTPAELNASITVRYGSQDLGAGRPGAVLLLMPGFLGGALSFDRLARQLVALDPTLAVWAVDRRSNALEPQDVLAAADPAELARIVQGGLPVRPTQSVGFMEGWGLDTTLRDWRAAVLEARSLTPNVFIGGHSMGGSLTGVYAAYDFDGTPGYADVRGLLMLDGTPGLQAERPITRDQYEQGGTTAFGATGGLRGLSRAPYVNLAFFGPTLASRAAAQARLAAQAPEALAPSGGLTPFPATNLAAGLLQIETRYALLPFLSLSTGRATNAVEAQNLLGRLLGGGQSLWIPGPLDPARPVGWQADPAAPTDPLDFVGRYWTPLGDFAEWYFPQRLTLDLGAARLGTRGTPFEQELRVWHTAEIPTPVLGIAAGRGLTKEEEYRRYAAQTRAPVTTRTLEGAAHLDITTARSDQVARWVLEWLAPLRAPTGAGR